MPGSTTITRTGAADDLTEDGLRSRQAGDVLGLNPALIRAAVRPAHSQ